VFCIVENDFGQFEIGLADDAAAFKTRRHAEAVVDRHTDDPPPKRRRRPRRANPEVLINRLGRAAATDKYATAETGASPLLATGSDCYRTVGPNGFLIGHFRTRREAAQASGVRS
jgi:hypothetical protein